MMKSLDHIGVAVNNLDEALKTYVDVLGFECEAREKVEDQKVEVAFLPAGNTHVELLEPTSPDGGIAKFLEKRGEGIHHLAFEVDDIEKAMSEYKEKGIRFIDEVARMGAGGKLVAFMYPKSTTGVLIELVQKR